MLCVSVCVPDSWRCCPPLPPWFSGRTGNHRGVQQAPLADTSDLSYWTLASHTSAWGTERGGRRKIGVRVRECVWECVFVNVREGRVEAHVAQDRWRGTAKCHIGIGNSDFPFCMFTHRFQTHRVHTCRSLMQLCRIPGGQGKQIKLSVC